MQCLKKMTKDTCPYNPLLGCDCGLNPAWTKEQLDKFIEEKENQEQVRAENRTTA